MDKKLLSFLRCPMCYSVFQVSAVLQRFPRSTSIRFGILKCRCDVFPIVEGIVFLKKSPTAPLKNRRAVELLQQGRYQQALLLLFDERRRAKLPYWFLVKEFIRPPSIQAFLRFLRIFTPASKDWLIHLAEREHRPTFFLSLANMTYVQSRQLVVDVGCSAGWFLKYLHAHHRQVQAIGLDVSFSALYLARKYVLKTHHTLICADADVGLPLRSNSADRVFANDTFMYFNRKAFFLQEASRIARQSATIFLSHVHNARAKNDGQGSGVSAQELAQYAQKYTVYGATDESLYNALVSRSMHTYTLLSTRIKPLSSRSYSFVVTKGKQFVPKLSPAWVHRRLRKTTLDFREDPQLQS